MPALPRLRRPQLRPLLQPLRVREKLIRISWKSLPLTPQPGAADKLRMVQRPARQEKGAEQQRHR